MSKTAIKPSEVEIVTEADVTASELSGLAANIAKSIELVASHEGAFEEATLEHRLEIGLNVAKAQEIFTLSNSDRATLGGEAKAALSRRDKAEDEAPVIPSGFVSWLKSNPGLKRLKRGTAYKYATAFRSLELPLESATPADIREKLKTLKHQAGKAGQPMPTLAALVKAAPKKEEETTEIIIPKTSKQKKLEDARESFHLWKEHWDKALKLGHLDHLDKQGLKELEDFTATVRDRIKARLK